jgi:hypothetical protein
MSEMGWWDSYWKWVYADEEEFIDVQRGIHYKANGTTRSMRGMFRNFDLPEPKETNGDALKLLNFLVKKGKVNKEDLIEFKGKE